MLVLILLSLFLLICLAYLLWVPVILEIDSVKGWYGLHIGRWVDIRLSSEHLADPGVQLRLGRWRKKWPITSLFKKKKEEEPVATPDQAVTTRKPKRRLSLRKWLKLLRTFKIRRLFLLIDTDDYVLNAYLFPISTYLQSKGWPVYINFMGRQRLQLQVENRAYRVLWAMFGF